MALKPNPGSIPPECIIRDDDGNITGFRRVRVVCFGGYDSGEREPAGWLSGGRGSCDWTISRKPHPFEISEYEPL